ncbi:MAG: TIM barrel protein, partial [Thermoguttaceae bacterium]|nr:TIM barrel protein [Thermoguttaceae bacterium]
FVQAAKKRDLVFAEVGRWCNPMDADSDKRKANHDRIIEGLALAEELGARCCVDIAGSFHPTSWYGPAAKNLSEEFFECAVENARKFIDAVKPKRTHFAYEAMGWSWPCDPNSYLRLMKAIDRKAFGVHLDICNMVNSPDRFWNMTGLINEAFDKLGPWIVSCHAKDLRWETELNLHFVECEIGQGQMDYATLLKRLARLSGEVPLMMEHQKDQAAYRRCRDAIMTVGRQQGISFVS